PPGAAQRRSRKRGGHFAPPGRPEARITPPQGAAQRRSRKRGGPHLGSRIAALPVIGLVAVRHEFADRPLGKRREIVSRLDDDAAQLEADRPAFWNGIDTVDRAEQ